MITRLHIRNFLSLRDVDITLSDKNVLVGANMSGKSNLIRALRFLTLVSLSNINKVVQDFGGFSELVWKGGKAETISFHMEAEYGSEWGELKKYYEYRLAFSGNTAGSVSVEREELLVGSDPKKKSFLANLTNGVGHITHPDGAEAFQSPGAQNSILQFNVPGWEGTAFRNIVSNWRFYNLHPPAMKDFNPVIGQLFLNETGNNLASWLLTIQAAHQERFAKIVQAAKSALPGLTNILAPPTQMGTTFLRSREEHLRSDVTVFHMSDGELKYIALLSLILAPRELGAPLFCIEEPETHLHPRLLENLITVFRQVRQELGPQAAQVLVTTHSPRLVDLMELDDLIVFDKRQGGTECSKPSSKSHLRKLLTEGELTLGELWYSGALSSD